MSQNLGEQSVVRRHFSHFAPDWSVVRLPQGRAGSERCRLLQLQIELLFELAQRGQVLVEMRPICGAQLAHEVLGLIADCGKHATPGHDFRVRCKSAAFGSVYPAPNTLL